LFTKKYSIDNQYIRSESGKSWKKSWKKIFTFVRFAYTLYGLMKNITIADFLEAHKLHGSSIMVEVALSVSQICIGWTISRLQKSNFAPINLEMVVEKARDIFDEAILLTFENAARGKIKAPEKDVKLSTYVTTVCRNLLYKKGIIMEPLDDGITDFDADFDADFELSAEQKEKLKKCKEKLSEKAKALVDLVLDGVPHVQIAALLGYKNEGVSRTTYSQALTNIRNCLGPSFFE
jgi:DNA-directed RNA polymerase specialized sigma24 family protein